MSIRTPRRLTIPFLALLALVLLPMTALTFAGPSRADAPSGSRTSAVPVQVPNASFRQGTRHWRAYGPGARLQASRQGHLDSHAVALVSPRHRAGGLRQVGASGPLTAEHGRVQASLWVWSPLARRVVVRVRSSHGTVASASRLVRARSWQHVTFARRVAGLQGARLSLDLTAGRIGPASRLLVDDVSVQLIKVVVPGPVTGPQPTTHDGTWMSGAAGNGVADGTFADWRGASVPIAGTWNDTGDAPQNQWSLQHGAEYGNWQGDLDDAIGAIDESKGESWAQAAAGAYDARWRLELTTLRLDWSGHPGTLYIRFAHEFNGEWYPWKVSGGQTDDFKAAWRRFRALQQEVFPASKLVFCANSVTSGSNQLDWRDAFPGKKYVDVMAVDWYNTQWGFIKDGASFKSRLTQTDHSGAPVGLEAYRLFAQAQGLPFAVSEWSSDGIDGGDSPAFIDSFHAWLAQHAGTGPGDVLYEILFNVHDFQDAKYQLYPSAKQPDASDAYRSDW